MNAARTVPAALILAGSRALPDPVATAEGVPHKSLVKVGGVALLERVARALTAAGCPRVAVSANDPEVRALATQLGLAGFAPGAGPAESVSLALAQWDAPLLVTTSDHALLEPRWVADFVADAPANADVAVLLAKREQVEAAAPGSRRTWLRFADGDWSGCNLFLLATPRASAAAALWQRVEAERKRPWRLAARLGWRMLASYCLGRLSLAQAVASLGRREGLVAAIVPARNGLAAVDVDRPGDLAQVRQIIGDRGS